MRQWNKFFILIRWDPMLVPCATATIFGHGLANTQATAAKKLNGLNSSSTLLYWTRLLVMVLICIQLNVFKLFVFQDFLQILHLIWGWIRIFSIYKKLIVTSIFMKFVIFFGGWRKIFEKPYNWLKASPTLISPLHLNVFVRSPLSLQSLYTMNMTSYDF